MSLDNMAWSGTNWLSWSKGLIVWYRLIMKCYARNYQNEINQKTNTGLPFGCGLGPGWFGLIGIWTRFVFGLGPGPGSCLITLLLGVVGGLGPGAGRFTGLKSLWSQGDYLFYFTIGGGPPDGADGRAFEPPFCIDRRSSGSDFVKNGTK